jgi:hypothetical protein
MLTADVYNILNAYDEGFMGGVIATLKHKNPSMLDSEIKRQVKSILQ